MIRGDIIKAIAPGTGLLLFAALAGCKPVVEPAPDQKQTSVVPDAAPSKVEELAVSRTDLLRALNEAASIAAVGGDYNAAAAPLAGRQFVLRMPIGCDGESDAATGWIYDSANHRLTLKATPGISLADVQTPPVASREVAETGPATTPPPAEASPAADAKAPATVPSPVEAVDGFWISHPWIWSDNCPIAPEMAESSGTTDGDEPKAEAEPLQEAVLPHHFGIAQYYTASDPRTGRRGGQAYRITKRVTEAEQPDPKSLRLVLRGRLTAAPDGRLLQCRMLSSTVPPQCIISATFDRVSFENADGSTVYAQWGAS